MQNRTLQLELLVVVNAIQHVSGDLQQVVHHLRRQVVYRNVVIVDLAEKARVLIICLALELLI